MVLCFRAWVPVQNQDAYPRGQTRTHQGCVMGTTHHARVPARRRDVQGRVSALQKTSKVDIEKVDNSGLGSRPGFAIKEVT